MVVGSAGAAAAPTVVPPSAATRPAPTLPLGSPAPHQDQEHTNPSRTTATTTHQPDDPHHGPLHQHPSAPHYHHEEPPSHGAAPPPPQYYYYSHYSPPQPPGQLPPYHQPYHPPYHQPFYYPHTPYQHPPPWYNASLGEVVEESHRTYPPQMNPPPHNTFGSSSSSHIAVAAATGGLTPGSASVSTSTSTSTASAAALVATGTALGLVAAAAVQWLQGGDFSIGRASSPSPSSSSLPQPLPQQDRSRLVVDVDGGEGSSRNHYPSSGHSEGHDCINDHRGERLENNDGGVQSQQQRATVLVDTKKSLSERLHDEKEEKEAAAVSTHAIHHHHHQIPPPTVAVTGALDNLHIPAMVLDEEGSVPRAAETAAHVEDVHAMLHELRRDMADRAAAASAEVVEGGPDPADTERDNSTADRWSRNLAAALEQLEAAFPHLRRISPPPPDVGTSESDEAEPERPDMSTEKESEEDDGECDLDLALPLPSMARLEEAIRSLAVRNERILRVAGAQLLSLYVANLSAHPKVPRYRKIFTSNDTYRQKLSLLDGANDLLRALGFQDGTHCLEWLPQDGNRDNPMYGESGAAKDREHQYLALLEKALAALKVLQAAEAESGSELAERAVAAFRPDDDDTAAAASEPLPPRPPLLPEPPASPSGVKPLSLDPDALRTPDAGTIISPPMTKKHATILLGHGFPPAHPLSALEKHGGVEGHVSSPASSSSRSPSPPALSRASPNRELDVVTASGDSPSEGDAEPDAETMAPW